MVTRNYALTTFASADLLQTIPAESVPAASGYNYAYSIWVYVNDWSYKYGSDKSVFVHGENGGNKPSLFLESLDNNAKVTVDMENQETFECTIQNIPLQKWTHILITMNTKSLDSYINGKLVKTCVLPSPPVIDYTSAVYITPSGGFSGYTSRFNYWNDTVNPQQAWNVYKKGPGGNMFTSFLNQYKIQLNFLKGSDVQASLTI
jgi:hypothetical protein